MGVSQDINVSENPALLMLFHAALLANEGELSCGKDGWQEQGDAVDCSLLVMAKKAGLSREEALKDYPPIAHIPYESQAKFSASIHEKDGKTWVFAKGAVETLLTFCRSQTQGEDKATLNHDAIKAQEQNLSGQQYRVLAFAYGEIERKPHYEASDLHGLTFLGMTGMGDPLRAEVKPALKDCRDAGIDVVMITGDHPQTAFAIAKELSLAGDMSQVVTGNQFRTANEQGQEAVDALTRNSKVYARVEPGQKLEIVDSLIRDGHFVAVTGDGVNDAPALKHAHVGVAMALKGTDVARESADIIITDDNFASIVSGIEEGRTVYSNIRKIVFFLITTSFAEVCMFIAAIASGLPIPLFATQLLWLNFATSIIQDVALAFEPPEGDELKQPPRNPKDSIFDRLMKTRILITATTMGIIAFAEFYWMLNVGGYSVEDARNLLLLQFVLFENVIVLNSQSETQSFFSHPLMRNPLLIYGTLAAQAMHIAAMYTPGLSDALHIHPVSMAEWVSLLGIALIPMAVIECEKWVQRKKHILAS
jgi:Ca2+-transporting ATPase